MTLQRFLFAIATAGLLIAPTRAWCDEAPPAAATLALAALKGGNERFVTEEVSKGKPNAERRAATAGSQHPIAIVVGCADSRTPPELIFDQNIGDLFVVRTAGNLVDDFALGSIEYAVEHLGARLIVVLGHDHCGAVKAAVESDSAPAHIGALVRAIRPAVEAAREHPGDLLANSIDQNIGDVAEKIRREAKLGSAAKDVEIVRARYDLKSGKVAWLND